MPKVHPIPVRQRVLDAGLALLREGGVKRVSQVQVARAAGVRQSHLTYYFPRKVDLMCAILDHSIKNMGEELEDFFASDGWKTCGESVRQRALATLTFLVQDRERTRAILSLILASDDDPVLRAAVQKNVLRGRAMLARGMGRADDDPEVDIAMATVWGLGMQHLLFEGARSDDYTAELVRRLPQMDQNEGEGE